MLDEQEMPNGARAITEIAHREHLGIIDFSITHCLRNAQAWRFMRPYLNGSGDSCGNPSSEMVLTPYALDGELWGEAATSDLRASRRAQGAAREHNTGCRP
jgi:hypothetical protein